MHPGFALPNRPGREDSTAELLELNMFRAIGRAPLLVVVVPGPSSNVYCNWRVCAKAVPISMELASIAKIAKDDRVEIKCIGRNVGVG